jgi:hypothetical protein
MTKKLVLSVKLVAKIFAFFAKKLCALCVKIFLTTEDEEFAELDGDVNGYFAYRMLKRVQHDKNQKSETFN